MPEPDAPATSPSPRESIDWSAYRTVELGQKIGGVLSLSERVSAIVRPLIVVMLLVAAADYGLLLWDARWLRILGTGYGLASGAIVGVFAGLAWLVYAEIQRIEELLIMMLDLGARIARDREAVRDDPDARPTPAETLPPVYEHIVGPLVAEVVKKQLGLLGRPASWLLDAILRRAVGLLAGILERRGITWESLERSSGQAEDVAPAAAPTPEAPSEPEPESVSESGPGRESELELEGEDSPERLTRTRVLVEQVGSRLRALFVPIWLMLVALALFFISPVAVVAYLAG